MPITRIGASLAGAGKRLTITAKEAADVYDVTVATRTYLCVPGADGGLRTGDPNGSYGNATKRTASTAAVVSCSTTQDLLPTLNTPTSVVFTSTQRGFWQIASNIYGATSTVSADGLTFTITYTPTVRRSLYIAARCVNAGNLTAGLPTTGIAVCRQHPGMRGVIKCGSGWAYASMRAGFDYAKAQSPSGGYAIVVKDGTYTNDDNRIFFRGGAFPASQQYYMPPPGTYTSGVQGAHSDPVYTITHWTSVMAETPGGVIIDGQGVRDAGIYLYGDTAYEWDESVSGGNLWNGTATDGHITAIDSQRRGIHIAGFVSKNTLGTGWLTQYCDHVFFEYGVNIDSCYGQVNYQNSCVQFQNSLDCLLENMHSMGGGRYLFSTYQSKRIVMRRMFGRLDWINTTEPHGACTPYRQRQFKAQNYLIFDSDNLTEFNTGGGVSDTALACLAATTVWDYGRDVYFDRGLGYNNQFGFLNNSTRDLDQSIINFFATDMSAWYHKNDVSGESPMIAYAGPTEISRMTSVYADNNGVSGYAVNGYRGTVNASHSIIYKYGHIHDGAGRAAGTMYYAFGGSAPLNLEANIDTSYLYDASYAIEKSGSLSSITVDVNTATNPTTIGMRYPGRIEPDSQLKTEGTGADNFYKALGKQGTFYGETGYTEETNQNWLAESMMEYFLPFYRNYSHTGPTNTLGNQTLSGNRGGATTAKLLFDYIRSNNGRDVPFITDLAGYANGNNLKVSWKGFATAYQSSVTAINIYIDDELVQTIAVTEHEAEFPNMVAGSRYKIKLSAVHSTFGESGISDEIEVSL